VRRNPHTEAEEPADAIIEPIAVEALNERLHATSVTPELDDAPPAAMRWSSMGRIRAGSGVLDAGGPHAHRPSAKRPSDAGSLAVANGR
jgi:hypothetical protein